MTAAHRQPDDQPFKGENTDKLLDSLLEGCQIINHDWRYLYLNDTAARQGRQKKEDLIGRTMMDVYPGIDGSDMFVLLRRCMIDRVPGQMENLFAYENGDTAWFELRFEPVPDGVFILSMDITERKRNDTEQRIMYDVLQLVNQSPDSDALLVALIERMQHWSGCEAVGIRLRVGVDFPYFTTRGFTNSFVRLENNLCSYNEEGEIELDAEGQPKLECMCGNILCGRYDPGKSFFTRDGSFWSNCTTELLATTTETDRQSRTRNRCNGVGYESVALIPLRTGSETFGLLQFNDKRPGRFTPERIALYRRVADRVALFLAKQLAESRVTHLNNVLRGIRDVNQLIIREKDPDRLLRQACEQLVDARGFDAVIMGITAGSDGPLLTHAGAGTALKDLQKMLAQGEIPGYARQAMAGKELVILRAGDRTNRTQPAWQQAIKGQDTLVLSLNQEQRVYGFMVTCLPEGMGDNLEEQDMLREVAGDIAFALHSQRIESERDKSRADLTLAQEQLRQAQKLEAIGRLAGGVAHDFNNILMAQMGYCDLMKLELAADDPLARDLGQIRICAERAATLTRQLLAFSRKQALQPVVLDLNTVICGIDQMLRRLIGEDIRFELELAEDLGRVMADPSQVEQVIMNMVINARDAMPRGGRLMIRTADINLDSDPGNQPEKLDKGSYVMLTVSDSGSGMDKRTLERVFEPFFTTKERGKGTGLGLAMVYGIVKQSGGDIQVESALGQGTTFRIYLPRVAADPVPLRRTPKSKTHGRGELILLVEDEPGLQTLFARIIGELGYRVRLAPNGAAALSLVEQYGLRPDLLITDVVMPGINGVTLAEQLIKIHPELRVLYISGYIDNEFVHGEIIDKVASFLQKPFSHDQLADRIQQVFHPGEGEEPG